MANKTHIYRYAKPKKVHQNNFKKPTGVFANKKMLGLIFDFCGKAFHKTAAFLAKVMRAIAKMTVRAFHRSFCGDVKHIPRTFSALVAVMFILGGGLTVFSATKTVSAVRVLLDNSVVGYVKDSSVVATAQVLAVNKVANSDCTRHLVVPTTEEGYASSFKLLSAEDLSLKIVSASTDIGCYSLLSIDGKPVAKGENENQINQCLEQFVKNYKQQNQCDSVELSARVKVNSRYDIKNIAEALPSIEQFVADDSALLPMERVYTKVENVTVPCGVTEIKTGDLYVGSERIKTAGQNGLKEVTYKVNVADDGSETKTEIASKTLKNPVNKVVYVGTNKVYSADKNGNAPMHWPVKRAEGMYVSSYMGDGRGHKGMDIVSKKGTPIYAAADGKVVDVGYRSGYGNTVIVSHGNGLETLYAHCSATYVSVGDSVVAGESIAAVGRSGYATGTHLHFEVHLNGNTVNPVPYIGAN